MARALTRGQTVALVGALGVVLLYIFRRQAAQAAALVATGAQYVSEQLDAKLQALLNGVAALPIVPTVPYALLPMGPPEVGPLRRNTSLDGLDPVFRAKVDPLLAEINLLLKPAGMSARMGETLRTWARQTYLYGIGRAYQAPGRVGTVTDAVTATGNHPKGKAVDFDYYVGGAYASGELADKVYAVIAPHASRLESKYGVRWGGRWKKRDIPHWEDAQT